MPHVVRMLMLAPLLIAHGNLAPANAETGTDPTFEWCLSNFPLEEGESAKPLPRPTGKAQPFELTGARTPPGLITRTEIVGPLPPEIEKYKGHWIWPTQKSAPHFAIFVERLTAMEMTIGRAVKPEDDRDEGGYRHLRKVLKWTGKSFSYSGSSAEGTETLDVYISEDGEAMLMWSGFSRLVTIEDRTGKKSSHTFSEGWPMCFISPKHY